MGRAGEKRIGTPWRLVACGLTSVVTCGCNFHVFSPPARLAVMESAEAAPFKQTTIGVGGGAALATAGLSGFGGYGSLAVRRGLHPNVEGSITATAGVFFGGSQTCSQFGAPSSCRPTNGDVGGAALRVGVKWAPWERNVAIVGGLGGGGSALGGFVAPDLGVIVSYDDGVVVPYASALVGMSQPIGASVYQWGNRASAPTTTLTVTVTGGLKIVVRPARSAVGGAILLGVGGFGLWDAWTHFGMLVASLGGEVTF